MAEITYQMILSTIQTAGLLVGIFYYIMTLRNQQKNQQLSLETRQAQLFMYMYDKWSSEDHTRKFSEIQKWEWKDYDDFQEKYGKEKNPDIYIRFSTIGRFFEGIGVLVKRELIDPYFVDDLMSSHILRFWDKFGESIIIETQTRENSPQYYEYIVYLAQIIRSIVEKQHPEIQIKAPNANTER